MTTFLKTHQELSPLQDTTVENLQAEFARKCYLKLPKFFQDTIFSILKEEAFDLLERHARRKDFIMEETESTKRHISTVSGNKVKMHSSFIPALYENKVMIEHLEDIAGEKLFLTPDPADRHAVHRLHRQGDIHGGHVDDYAFVLIMCLEAPNADQGGEIEFVPNSTNIKDLGTSKSLIDRLEVGDAYFMRSNKAVHRVLPLKEDTNRTVVVFTYADLETKNISVSYSSDSLYD